MSGLKVNLIDGTYELFRHFYGSPPQKNSDGMEVAAVRGVITSLLRMLGDGVTHLGVATDHRIESWRNDSWPGYKTSDGVPSDLLSQFPLLEEAIDALGVKLWPMEELEADDALASAAAVAHDDPDVEQVIICTPDKDLGQCLIGNRVVQYDRRKRLMINEAAMTERYGIPPSSLPDWLALVGDSADGFPGLTGWGARTASVVLGRYLHVEDIPDAPGQWDITVRGAVSLASTLAANRELVALFKDLATLRVDRSLLSSVDELRWSGPKDSFAAICDRIEGKTLLGRAEHLASELTASNS